MTGKKITSAILFLIVALFSITAFAHGTMEIPISRVYNCFKEGPENPKSAACKAAVAAGGKQALYDWNGINQGAANDRHQALIPDGTLCAGGRDLFKGMNLARTDWPTTTVTPDGSGLFQFTWYATAPHAIKYFKFYLTKDGYNFSQPLRWSDLDAPFCTVTSVPLQNSRYKMSCPLPNKGGRRILYVIWQRSDSQEAFYSCSDIMMTGDGGTNPDPDPIVTSWKEIGSVYAQTSVVIDTKISFRLFKNGQEVERHAIVAIAGHEQASQWPYYLAQEVNARSTLTHIGQLNATNGNVLPSMSSSLNKVYISDPNTTIYTFAIDFTQPGEQVDFVYPDNIANYQAGTIVVGFDQKRYQCKPWPYSSWCRGPALYYEPGKGLDWQNAWILL